MRILLLSNKSPWPPKDGGSSATLGLIDGLSAAGAHVTVLAFNTIKHLVYEEDIPDSFRQKTELILVKHDTSVNLLSLTINLLFSRKPYTLQRFRSQKLSQRLSVLLSRNYDIVQIEGLAMSIYLDQVKKESSGRIVYRAHNVENKIWYDLSNKSRNPFYSVYFRSLASRLLNYERHILNRFDAVVPITQNDHDWFLRSGLCVPSLSVPSWRIPEDLSTDVTDSFSVFYIGALDWLPNIAGLRWFIRNVWPYVLKAEKRAVFHIAGRNCSAKTEKILRVPGVIFHGEVESSAKFISKYSVMAVPLFSGSGLRIKILEGMIAGKAIVATPSAASGLSFKDGTDIFIASDPEEFAKKILTLFENSKLRLETGRLAKDNVSKNYNILVSSNSLLKFYSEEL